MGVMVEAGIVKEGTPICVARKKDDEVEVYMSFLRITIFMDSCVCKGDKKYINFTTQRMRVVCKIDREKETRKKNINNE